MLKRELTKEDCLYWYKNKNKNPITKYSLKADSKILKEITEKCTEILKDADINKPSDIIKKVKNIPKDITRDISIQQKKSSLKDDDTYELHYPNIKDPLFSQKISSLYEFNIHKIPVYPTINSIKDFNEVSNKLCNKFEKSYYQHFLSQYISSRTPYKSILLYHAVGVGKTCSAITIAETFLIPHNMHEEPKIWVILPQALKSSFKEQIFNFENIPLEQLSNQCTGDTYIKLLNITNKEYANKNKLKYNVKKLISTRYKIFTYDAFHKYIDEHKEIVKDKIIIIDEVHNIRNTEKENKQIYIALKDVLSNGINNRLVLLTATPMYNEPADILDLLYLLLLNDKRYDIIDKYKNIFENQSIKIDETILNIIKQLSGTYISYLRGKDPFTFALKLSPKDSGINIINDVPDTDPFGKLIAKNELKWINDIEDGIVPSLLGKKQLEYINMMKDINENNIFNNLQPMNIVYDNEIGEKGFYTLFTKATDKEPLCVRYNKKYENALLPSEEHLGLYSGKFLNICNFIRKTKGISVIYSRYRYSGIIPLAISLEHMGFSREGTNNILEKAEIIKDYVKYDGIKNPKYCILSSENKDIMGTTTIDKLIKIINDPKNINGSLIKVILITPVASEGLSFYNTREIHLIEPWYHFNRAVQIIGRGIRNCRHQQLKLEDKNTTVFMHASIYDNNLKESIDLHALRISTRKYAQSNIIDNIIRNNSIDCYLMKNINYFSKDLFNLGKVNIITSQGVIIPYQYGDKDNIEPICNVEINKINKKGYRREIYKHLVNNVRTLLKNIILKEIRNNNFYISIDKICNSIENYDYKIIYETISTSIYPYTLIDGYSLIPHENGIHIISIKPQQTYKINIVYEKDLTDKKPQKPQTIKVDKDINIATIALYSSLDSNTFNNMMVTILEKEILNETETYMASILYIQGVLIKKNELKSFKNNTNEYIGYINIFNIKNNLDVILYNSIDKKYRDANENEKKDLIKSRIKKDDIPDMSKETLPWGLFVPKKHNDVIINVFKILTSGESAGKKTGMNCISLKKQEHNKIFDELNIKIEENTKIFNCSSIANALYFINRMTLLPYYKPILV